MPADERFAVRRDRARASVPRPLTAASAPSGVPLPDGLALRGRLATGARRPETPRGSGRGGPGSRPRAPGAAADRAAPTNGRGGPGTGP